MAIALALPAPVMAQLPITTDCGQGSVLDLQPATSANSHFEVSGTPTGGLTETDYLDALDTAYQRQVSESGWWAPPLPAGETKYTVVVDGSPAPAGGGRATSTGTAGNNPNSDWADGDAQYSCLHLTDSFPSRAALEATAAREFNRMVLLGIGALSGITPDVTLTESSLALVEELTFPAADIALNDLWPDFADSLGAYDGANKRSQWIALRGLTERYGTSGHTVLQDMWKLTSIGPDHDLAALDAALSARGTPLGQAFHDYAVAARGMRSCSQDEHPFCFTDAPAYVAKAGARPDHEQIAVVGDQATGSVEDDYALQWIKLPDAKADVTVTNTASGGVMRATAVCTSGSQPLRVPFPNTAIGAGQSSKIQAFPPTGCTDAAVVLSTASRTATDPTQSVLRPYIVATGPPTVPLTITIAGTGAGVVASDPSGPSPLFCVKSCGASFPQGTAITLGAAPTKTSTFTGWGGACSGTAALCTVTLDDAKAVTATFKAIPAAATPTPAATPPASEPSQGDKDLAADAKAPRIGLDKLTLSRNLRTLSVRVTCPASEPHRCSGFVALTAVAAKKRLNFGQQAFLKLKGGRRKVLRFAVTARSRSAIRRAGKLRVTISSRTRDDAFNYVTQRRKISAKVRG